MNLETARNMALLLLMENPLDSFSVFQSFDITRYLKKEILGQKTFLRYLVLNLDGMLGGLDR